MKPKRKGRGNRKSNQDRETPKFGRGGLFTVLWCIRTIDGLKGPGTARNKRKRAYKGDDMGKEPELIRNTGILEAGYGIAPMLVLADRRISKGSKLVYFVLSNYARNKDQAFPAQKTIAEILKIRIQRVSTLIAELEKAGYISKAREGKHGRIIYTMLSDLGNVDRDLFGGTIKKKRGRPRKNPDDPKDKEIIEGMKELESIYFKTFKKKIGHDPEYPFGIGRKTLKGIVKKYGMEKGAKIMDGFFKNDFAKRCGYGINILPKVMNQILMKIGNGGTGEGYGFAEAK